MRATLFAVLCLFAYSIATSQTTSSLEVVIAAPRGETPTIDQTQTIFASFNEPMVPLKEIPTDEGAGPLEIRPKIEGKFRWMGTRTIAFIPAGPLPFATQFIVTVPAGTASLAGRKLEKEYRWVFETPRPRVVLNTPYNTQRFVELNHTISIRWNQTIDPDKAGRFLSVEENVRGTRSYPQFSVRLPGPDEITLGPGQTNADSIAARTLVITVKGGMQKGAKCTVRAKAGLPGTEGPLGMISDHVFSFSTYDDLAFLRVKNEDRFNPAHALVLVFSNPVSIKDVARLLVFDPTLKLDAEQIEYDYQTDEVPIRLTLEPEMVYHATLKPGLKDRFGNAITQETKFSFRTGSFPPFVRMTTGPGVIEAYESHKYPVTFMNIDSVRLQMGKLTAGTIVPLMRRLDFSYYSQLAEEEAILETPDTHKETGAEITQSRIWRIGGTRNKQSVRPLDLDELLGKSTLGVAFVQVDNLLPGDDRRYYKALLQVTHLGITAKFSPTSSLIWVTGLKDALPVAGASIEMRSDSNRVVWTGKTDAKGVAEGPGWGLLGLTSLNDWQPPRLWVVAKKGDDMAFSSSDWQNGIEPWQFGISQEWNPQVEPMLGSLFTDRGLYKAGEQVEIKGIVRSRKGSAWGIPRGREFRLIVHNARNEEILLQEPKLSPFGSFAFSLPLKPTAPLGYYSIDLSVKESSKPNERWTNIGNGQFRVEAFRSAEFEVTARSDQKTYIVGDTFEGSLQARYLFGAPLKNEPVTWRTSVTATGWRPVGYDGYFFGPMFWLTQYTGRFTHRLLSSKQERLDDQGAIRVTSPIEVGEVSGTVSLLLEGDVTSPTRQQISGRTSVIVHGGEFYVGISPSSTFIKSDSTLTYRIITVSTEGDIVPDVSLHVKIYQHIWRSVRKAESGGRYAWQSEIENIPVDSAELHSGKDPVLRTFKTGQPGFYFIEVNAKDKRGNELVSHCYFYVSGSGYVPWARTNDDRIELVADRTQYKPGDRAGILVKSPYEKAVALISVEREGIISHYTTTLAGSAPQIDLPILKEYLPNVFVSVVLLQGRRSAPARTKEGDVGRPSFKVGYIGLSVSPLEKLLTLRVETDKKEYRPADSVEVRIRVQDSTGRGREAEVTLSVADLGVLNLTGYRLPNPFDAFYSQRSLAVRTTETRMHLVEQREYGEKGEAEGGGGAEAKALALVDAEGVRKDFRATAYWHPSLRTDSAGEVRAKFRLPDNLTSFQVMAVGHTLESEFGCNENTITVNKPLLLQPSLPRFARVGDAFEGGVVILNYSDRVKDVRLAVTASGVKGGRTDTSRHRVKPGQAVEVRGKYAAEKIGKAVFTFRARTDDDSDGLQWTIPINIPRARESVALYEATTDSVILERIAIPKEIFKGLGEIEMTAASTAMLGLSGGMSYLFTYPYGCLEQRLSAVLPIILAKDLVEAFRFEVYQDKEYRQVVGKILDEVPSFQRWNGGFAYWKNTQDTWPYISAYAVYTMVQAKRAGYPVNEGVLRNGLTYLRNVMNGAEVCKYYTPAASNCTRALILYTLSLSGTPEHGYMEQLYKERRTLPLFARAYLLRALHAGKGNQNMIQDLARDLLNQAKIAPASAHFEERDNEGLDWIFSSNTRTTALVMQSLVETQPEQNLIPKVVRWLLEQRKSGHWRTTQENLYVVDALAAYFKKYEKEEPNFRVQVRLEGKDVMRELFQGRSFKTASGRRALGELTPGTEYAVNWTKSGAGRLYYGVRMNYYPAGESTVREEGFTVLKSMEEIEGSPRKGGVFGVSGLVRVTLTLVTNQERHFVAVNDPLPAGFETINSSFLTTASTIDQYEQGGEQRDWWTYNPFNHKEMYDDRVQLFADYLPAGVHTFTYMARATSYGRFQMPATRVEGMYEPEVFGQTSSRLVTVE